MIEYRIGDVRDRVAEIPDGSVDLIVTSPPFLALRSYLPADHPDKGREIGSEATPADFLDTLLALTAEWGRVLAPHGSLCVELGDTYSGSSQGGGDLIAGSGDIQSVKKLAGIDGLTNRTKRAGTGWPLSKSLTGIPTLYPWSLAYGRNLLTGAESPAGQWRIRNVIVWARPNPPVGALGDKFRPATSYITVACRGAKRYFDLDAVRHEHVNGIQVGGSTAMVAGQPRQPMSGGSNPAGAPPLDWHADQHPEDGDWLWKMATAPFNGRVETVRWVPAEADARGDDTRRIASPDCPRHGDLPGQVPKALRDARAGSRLNHTPRTADHPELTLDLAAATNDANHDCADSSHGPTSARSAREGSPAAIPRSTSSRRTGRDPATTQLDTPSVQTPDGIERTSASPELSATNGTPRLVRDATTLGWSDCGHDNWRTGIVLDPFAGSGTTLEAAQAVGRHAIGIDLDSRNAELARERVGMFLAVAGE